MNFQTQTRYESRRRIQKKSNHRGGFFIAFLVVVFFGIFSYFTIAGVGETFVKSGTYSLEKGTTLKDIPDEFSLEVNVTLFKLYLRFFAPEVTLQAGSYRVEEDSTLETLLRTTLKKPIYTDLTITILPGWNMYDIDSYLSDKKILDAGAFLLAARDHFTDLTKKYSFLSGKTSLEGFLYPDTYRILPSSDAYMIIDKLLAEWKKKIGPDFEKLSDAAYTELILASIVEREERKIQEQPIVAGILSKRVKEGIPMGADATVCYEYAKTQKQCTPEFIASVITEKNPYNTRNKQGYPPTPISSVSQNTWESVKNKVSSEYYYYLHDTSGVIHYGKTLGEHNANKAKYLQ